MLMRKIVAQKPEYLGDANQALKHQFAHNLRDPYFRVVARGQCLVSPDSKSFTQFWGHLAMMFGSRGKHAKVVHTTSAAVTSEEIGRQEQHLSHSCHKHPNKINAQATKIATVKSELNKVLQENQKLKNVFIPDQLVEAMSKVVSTMTIKECLKNLMALSIKGPQVMWAGSSSPSWHVVLMGCWSLTSPATLVKTLDTQRTTVSDLTIKLCWSCRCKNRWQLLRQHQKRVQ